MHHNREDNESEPNSRHRNHEDADERIPDEFFNKNDGNSDNIDEYREQMVDENNMDEYPDEEEDEQEFDLRNEYRPLSNPKAGQKIFAHFHIRFILVPLFFQSKIY